MTNAPMGILNSSFSELKRMGQGNINRKSKFSFHDSCPLSLHLKQRHPGRKLGSYGYETFDDFHLIGGWAYPSEKYEFVSWDDDIPNWMESHKIPSKPPTSHKSSVNYGKSPFSMCKSTTLFYLLPLLRKLPGFFVTCAMVKLYTWAQCGIGSSHAEAEHNRCIYIIIYTHTPMISYTHILYILSNVYIYIYLHIYIFTYIYIYIWK